ncbi:hypothetical protein SDC9_36566 [bioreactor metagenome]|uniref:Uncharacterized protein n=1 Tax=bioreactor metagenome TaxID=1076179 RepID=A0A644VGJ0_9ZZZZ
MSAVLRVERVAQPVADEEEAEEGGDEEEKREGELPQRAIGDGARALGDQRAKRGHRFLHAQAEEGDEAFGQDHVRHQKRGEDGDDADQVRQDVAADDGARRHADGARRLDIVAVLQRQGLAAHDPAHLEPGDQPDTGEEHGDRAAIHHQQQDQHEHVGDGQQDIDGAHHDVVDAAAEIARGRAPERADDDRDRRADDADGEANLRALNGACEEVAAEVVGAEVMAGLERGTAQLGRLAHHGKVDLVIAPAREAVAEEREEHDEDKEQKTEERRLVAQEAAPGIGPERAAGDVLARGGGGEGLHFLAVDDHGLNTGSSGRSIRR